VCYIYFYLFIYVRVCVFVCLFVCSSIKGSLIVQFFLGVIFISFGFVGFFFG
jgi:hypothetical protein